MTTFADWLTEAGDSVSAFALRMGINNRAIYWLAGVRPHLKLQQVTLAMLDRVSAETGIPAEVLAFEAIQASRNPKPPRAYRRREKQLAAE